MGGGGDVVNFPAAALTVKLGKRAPIDAFLNTDAKTDKAIADVKERKKLVACQNRALSAFERPLGPPDVDKTLTRQRMGFFVCFDAADDDMSSLKEACKVYRQLKEKLNEEMDIKAMPIIWFVACKIDHTANTEAFMKNMKAARVFTQKEQIPMRETSARSHQGTSQAFTEMVSLIEGRMNFWRYRTNDDGEDTDDEGIMDGNCSL